MAGEVRHVPCSLSTKSKENIETRGRSKTHKTHHTNYTTIDTAWNCPAQHTLVSC